MIMVKVMKVIGLIGIVASGIYLLNYKVRQNDKKNWYQLMINSNKINDYTLGKPKDMEESKMMAEGAMTSVQYFNELQEQKYN